MKIKTIAETVDIRKGVPFVEMRIAGVPFMGMSVMVALSEWIQMMLWTMACAMMHWNMRRNCTKYRRLL